MRAAVYNRFWHSQGGGERHSGMVAQVLRAGGAEVDVVGHGETDLGELGAHLGLDLQGCTYRSLPDRGDATLAVASEDYDLWVTASYMSRLAPRSRRAAYLCYFPTPFDHDLARWRRALVRAVGPHVQLPAGALVFGTGWFPPEGGRLRQWSWASGDAVLTVPPGGDRALVADIGRPGAPGPTRLEVTDEQGVVSTVLDVAPDFARVAVPLPASPLGYELHLRSDVFVPGAGDTRELGVALSRARLTGDTRGVRARIGIRYPWLRINYRDLSFLDSYDVVLANSDYTRGWIRELWGRDADVLYPPVPVQRITPAPAREQAVLSVGRFFAPGLGHAKRQLEMVQWFGDLVRGGQLSGWRLHVVGGCEESQRPYLAQVAAAAKGLPVELHPNAPRETVERLLSTASVFWSATGYGESERRPWAAEHFGMTTVEAMAGGCVPVVIDKAGQREIVREGVDGFRWRTPEGLGEATVRLAGDEPLRGRLAASARVRAQRFSDAAFVARWRGIAETRDLLR